MSTLTIIGWAFLITSWIVPIFIEDKQKGRLAGLILSGIACVIFLASLISKIGA
jgi:hypothetical protein